MIALFDLFVQEPLTIDGSNEVFADAPNAIVDPVDVLFALSNDVLPDVVDASSHVAVDDFSANSGVDDDQAGDTDDSQSDEVVSEDEVPIETVDSVPFEMPPIDAMMPDQVDSPLETTSAQPEGPLTSETLWGDITEFLKDFSDFFLQPLVSENALVHPRDFSNDGTFDNKNDVVVVGNVANDIQYVDQQTGSTCSLMAQEQFVHRYIGKSIPEDYLAWQGEQWGGYAPSGPMEGTNYIGQTMILDHFEIPYERSMTNWFNSPATIEEAIDADKDLIVGVDAREFYEDPTFPPGSGHAVAVVGKGVDSVTHETAGFYITDSNMPGTVRFMDIESFDRAWTRDMIAIPNPPTEVA